MAENRPTGSPPERFPLGWSALAVGAVALLGYCLFRPEPSAPRSAPPAARWQREPGGVGVRRANGAGEATEAAPEGASRAPSEPPPSAPSEPGDEPEPPGARNAIPWPLWVRGVDAGDALGASSDASTDGGEPALEQARVYFRQGAEAYEARSWTLAAGYFERAYAQHQDPISLVLAADSRLQTGDRTAAAAHLQRVLDGAAPGSLAAWRARRLAATHGMPELLAPRRDGGGAGDR
ncbi:MAG: hypothetical protein HY909_12095 [Deltaproteobacteria bacterium]|nr:hypothetical protein [Deltaproteobacteria bacterium]